MGLEVKNNVTFKDCAFGDDRKRLALFLTNYLNNEKNIVMNIDGEWGTGKTFFVKAWGNHIKDKHPVIHIDAWKTDFSENPLMVIVETVLRFFKSQEYGINIHSEEKILRIVAKLGAVGAKISAGVATTALGGSYGIGHDGLTGIIDASKEALNIASKIDYENYKNKLEAIKEFKKEMGHWIDNFFQYFDEIKPPVYIFIDELDRCRPTYAIQMLETIKHFFDFPCVAFILSTNVDQLACSIRAVYGESFNAGLYLDRFFDNTAKLPAPSYIDFCKSALSKDSISYDGVELCLISLNDDESALEMFSCICEYYKVPLRNVRRIHHKLRVILANISESNTDRNRVVFPRLVSLLIEEQYAREYCNLREELPFQRVDQRTERYHEIRKKMDGLIDQSCKSPVQFNGKLLDVEEILSIANTFQEIVDEEKNPRVTTLREKMRFEDRIQYRYRGRFGTFMTSNIMNGYISMSKILS